MKNSLLFLITLTLSFSVSAQLLGDFRSIGSGNWNDATKWEIFNGSSWVVSNSYPGQDPGTNAVSIRKASEITINASIPYPLISLHIIGDTDRLVPSGKLVFRAENAVSLTVSGTVIVDGSLGVSDQIGTKAHLLFIGGSLQAGSTIGVEDPNCVIDPECWECYCPLIYYSYGGDIQTISNDDKLSVLFKTTIPDSWINGHAAIIFQDISFDGIGISVGTSISISGTASFINGIVRNDVSFNEGAISSGSSPSSFVEGRVWKRGDGSFTFPIGENGIYSPLTASIPNGQVATLNARYTRNSVWPIISWGIMDPDLYNVSDCEFWELNAGASVYDSNNVDYPVDITLGWRSFSSCVSSPYITNVATVNMAHLNFNRKGWETHGGTATGTLENGTVTWSGVKSLGVFTLGNINNNCVPPSTLATTNITTETASLNWSAISGALSYDVEYKRNTTERWTRIVTATTATSVTVSDLSTHDLYDWRVRTNCNSSQSAYRMTRFTRLYPCGTPTGLNTTNITTSGAKLNWSPVTNAFVYSVWYKESNSTSWIEAAVNIGTTYFVLTGLSAAMSYDWKVSVLCRYGSVIDIWGGGSAQSSFTTLTCNDLYETNNTSNQAKGISLGASVSANISSVTDVDWFKITTPNSFNNLLMVTLANLPADYDLYVYNKNLVLVGSSIATGTSNEVVFYNSPGRKMSYYIKVIGKNAVYNTSQCYSLLAQVGNGITSASRISDKDISETDQPGNQLLYPNPASEFVILRFNSMVQGTTIIQIFNSTGQLVKQQSLNLIKGYNQARIPIKEMRQGMYFLRINKGELNMIKKFITKR